MFHIELRRQLIIWGESQSYFKGMPTNHGHWFPPSLEILEIYFWVLRHA